MPSSHVLEAVDSEGIDLIDIQVPPSRSRSKKRVQFPVDKDLVRIREISPRENRTPTDDDSDECDDDSLEDESDDDTDISNSSSEDEDIVKHVKSIPSIVNKHSPDVYKVSKTKGKKSARVITITGGHVASKARSKTKERKYGKANKPRQPVTGRTKGLCKPAKNHYEGLLVNRPKLCNNLNFNFSSLKGKSHKHEHRNAKSTHNHHNHNRHCVQSPVTKLKYASADNSVVNMRDSFKELSLSKLYTIEGITIQPQLLTQSARQSAWPELENKFTSNSLIQKQRWFAWNMAKGDEKSILFRTPYILPM